jgi:hypothetical protein
MSYRLGRKEDDAKVSKTVNEAQEYYNAQDKWEWVEWAGKILMLHLHAQIAMGKADTMRAEQEVAEELGSKTRGHSGSRNRRTKRWSWMRERLSSSGRLMQRRSTSSDSGSW